MTVEVMSMGLDLHGRSVAVEVQAQVVTGRTRNLEWLVSSPGRCTLTRSLRSRFRRPTAQSRAGASPLAVNRTRAFALEAGVRAIGCTGGLSWAPRRFMVVIQPSLMAPTIASISDEVESDIGPGAPNAMTPRRPFKSRTHMVVASPGLVLRI